MTEIRKETEVLKQSSQIFQDILTPLAQREADSFVYFCRIIGCADEQRCLAEIADLDESLRKLGNYSLFCETIPVTTDSSLVQKTKDLIGRVELKDFRNGMLANILQTQGYFSLTSNPPSNLSIRDAFQIMLDLYLKNQQTVNLNIAANFVIKILGWLAEYRKTLDQNTAYNPKMVYWGSPKIHEIYFLILMYLCECDVLVLNPSFKDNFDQVDPQNKFCYRIKKTREIPIGAFPRKNEEKNSSQIKLPPVGTAHKASAKANPVRIESERFVSDHVIVAKLVKSSDIFADILIPLDKRSGFVGEPYPILPTYFTRYIGVPDESDDWETEYYNHLFNLNLTFQASGSYLKFLKGIPAPDALESALIPQRLHDFPYKDISEIFSQIISAKLLPKTQNELMDNTITKVFVDIVSLFAKEQANANLSVLLNFSLKLVMWFNRYISEIFKYPNIYRLNPKILFYGNIKPHEIYLLSAFHQLGCDVLFIHSSQEGDKPFQSFDKANLLSTLILNEHNLPLGPFPQTERLVRKSTVAYNASKEIESVIYGEEVGLFKPWQFESYLTEPVTLKTTYDELKILWSEPAKIRPEFKVQNQKVYVPNLFAKINGVSENIENYWQDLKGLITTPNTKFIEAVPFTHISYTKQELFQMAYLFNGQGVFDKTKIMKSPRYKFSFLKTSLQHFLLTKLNELILSEMFLGTVDEKLKLKILMTVLTMSDSLLRLIEVFDFPQEIPKVVLYDNTRNGLSEEDAILIAYLNLIGLDIVIFTPTNYTTIDQYIKTSLFDIHQLPSVTFELPLPAFNRISTPQSNKQGLISRFFKFRS